MYYTLFAYLLQEFKNIYLYESHKKSVLLPYADNNTGFLKLNQL